MKKSFPIILLLLAVTFTSCSKWETGMSDNGPTVLSKLEKNSFFGEDEEKIADQTFAEIIDAVQLQDDSKIVDMFADSIKSEQDLLADASRFVDFIQGEIISVSNAFESGVGTQSRVKYGKKSKEIQSSFCVTTTENIYYVAVRERTKDEIDNKTGLLSIHIIEAKNWTTEYVYRGDGKRVEEGIYIVQEAIKIVD